MFTHSFMATDTFGQDSTTIELSPSLEKLRQEFPERFALLDSHEVASLEESLLMMPEAELEGLINNLRSRMQGEFTDFACAGA